MPLLQHCEAATCAAQAGVARSCIDFDGAFLIEVVEDQSILRVCSLTRSGDPEVVAISGTGHASVVLAQLLLRACTVEGALNQLSSRLGRYSADDSGVQQWKSCRLRVGLREMQWREVDVLWRCSWHCGYGIFYSRGPRLVCKWHLWRHGSEFLQPLSGIFPGSTAPDTCPKPRLKSSRHRNP